MQITLTHLRQNLFTLADEVLRSGEPLWIERNGALLKLVRAEAAPALQGGRLARLQQQDLAIGAPLAPDESPSAWLELHQGALRAAKGKAAYVNAASQGAQPAARRRKPR